MSRASPTVPLHSLRLARYGQRDQRAGCLRPFLKPSHLRFSFLQPTSVRSGGPHAESPSSCGRCDLLSDPWLEGSSGPPSGGMGGHARLRCGASDPDRFMTPFDLPSRARRTSSWSAPLPTGTPRRSLLQVHRPRAFAIFLWFVCWRRIPQFGQGRGKTWGDRAWGS